MKTKYEIYQDGEYVKTVEASDPDKAFAEARDHIACGEWKTPGTVRVSMSIEGQQEYIRDARARKVIDEPDTELA